MNFLENRNNRTIAIVCTLIALVCIYLIQDDSLFRMISFASSDDIGHFEGLQKDVRKKKLGNYFWEDLTSADRLVAGDSIFTGSDSSVIVKLYGGQTIMVAPNSMIKFRTKNKKLVIDIPYGDVQLNKVAEGGVVISDCGQDIDLKQSADSVKLKKSEKCGSVTLDTKSIELNREFKKAKKDIKETFFEVANTGVLGEIDVPIPTAQNSGPVGAPRFENLDIKHKAAQNSPLVLKWAPVAHAHSYEIEVSEAPDFARIEKTYTLKQLQVSLENVTSNLFFRGKTRGIQDQVSEFSEIGRVQVRFPRIKIDQPTITKDYSAKNPADTGAAQSFEVSWSAVPMADNYVVEVRDPETSKTIKKFSSRKPASSIQVPRTGKYAYQVYAQDARGRKISSSDVGEVIYNKVFDIVAPIIKQGLSERFYFFQRNAGRYVWLNWLSEGISVGKFRVEVATDKDFSNVIKSVFTTKKKLLMTDQIREGEYFWRVRAENNDQFSDWSNTESFKIKVGQ